MTYKSAKGQKTQKSKWETKLTFATHGLQLVWPDSQIWGRNYSKYSLGHITRMPHVSFLILPPLQIVQEPSRHLAPEVLASKLQAKEKLAGEFNQFIAGFLPTAVQLLSLPHGVTVEHWLWTVCSSVSTVNSGALTGSQLHQGWSHHGGRAINPPSAVETATLGTQAR